MLVNLDNLRTEKQYKEFYKQHSYLANNTTFLHTSKRSNDFNKQYTTAWIKLLSSNINKDGEFK
jgi:hypothetical protein